MYFIKFIFPVCGITFYGTPSDIYSDPAIVTNKFDSSLLEYTLLLHMKDIFETAG